MEITLEKIELVKDRTGVTYAEAKAALEEADGSVVDAIIAIEETINAGETGRGFGEKGEALFASLKNLIKKGNVAKIIVKRDDEIIVNVPLNAGIVGLCIAPLAAVVAVVASFGFKCIIEVVKTDGTIIDVSDAVTDTVSSVAEKGSDKADLFKNKSKEYYDKVKDSEFAEKAMGKAAEAKEKAAELYEKGKVKAEEVADKLKRDPEVEVEFEYDEDEEVEMEAPVEEAVVEEAAEAAEEIIEEEEK